MSTTHNSIDHKRIVICCDGTWQSATSGQQSSPSNVTRLARCLARDATDKDGTIWQQIVWYDSGIGTTSGTIGRVLEGAVGQGLEANVIEAYNFCVLNYAPGDQIFCFGFSRGAYTARAIAGLISDIGIIKPNQLNNFHEIWKLYKETKPGQRFHGSEAYYRYLDGEPAAEQPEGVTAMTDPRFVWVTPPHDGQDWSYGNESHEIEVVGVWDTVGSLGMPSVLGYQSILFGPDKQKSYNVALNPNVKNAFHALALDEHRKAFQSTLWHVEEKSETTTEDDQKQSDKVDKLKASWEKVRARWIAASGEVKAGVKQELELATRDLYTQRAQLLKMKESHIRTNLVQVWFPGMHINVGGGSDESLKDEGDLEEMANITFAWMLDQIKDHLAINRTIIDNEAKALKARIAKLNKAAESNRNLDEKEKEDAKNSSWGSAIWKGAASVANSIAHPFTPGKWRDIKHREQTWGLGPITDSFTVMYTANGSEARTPGGYVMPKDATVYGTGSQDKVPNRFSNEQVHPVVGYRMQHYKGKDKYQPVTHGKNKFSRKQRPDKTWEYKVDENKTLSEFKLQRDTPGPDDAKRPFERCVILSDHAQEYVRALDKDNGY